MQHESRMVTSEQTNSGSWFSLIIYEAPRYIVEIGKWSFFGIWNLVITKPLRLFYFMGPIWRNKPYYDICAQMTGVKSTDWIKNPDACFEKLEQDFVSWDITVLTVSYFLVLYFIVAYTLWNCFFIGKITKWLSKRRRRNQRQRRNHSSINTGKNSDSDSGSTST